MADNTRHSSSSSRIAFTLPISCQICLGKVKQPVVCPNQHAFCSPCMDIWLQRNQQCPSCRIDISDENPCKKILGGLSHNEEEQNDFAKNKELRRSRLELLCKDYEDEIERLSFENEALEHEKAILGDQLKNACRRKQRDSEEDSEKGKGSSSQPSTSSNVPDTNMLMVLTKKLHDATGLYEKVKKDMDKLKLENNNVKDENTTLGRENQRLRMELVGRSPRKFGRFTVATLETKLEQYQKEMKQLEKALERSDTYIEEVEQELDGYRKKLQQQNLCMRCKTSIPHSTSIKDDEPSKRGKPSGDAGFLDKGESFTFEKLGRGQESTKSRSNQLKLSEKDDQRKSKVSGSVDDKADWKKLPVSPEGKKSLTINSFYGKKPSMVIPNDLEFKGRHSKATHLASPSTSCDASYFELELPSSSSPCISQSPPSTKTSNESLDSFLNKGNTKDMLKHSDNSAESAKKKLKFESSDNLDISDMSFLNSPKKGKGGKKTCANVNKQVTFNQNVSVKNMSANRKVNDSVLDVTLPSETSEIDVLNDLKGNSSTNFADDTFEMNCSMSSDIIDCMELFDNAERRLGQQKGESQSKGSKESHKSEAEHRKLEEPSSSTNFNEFQPVSTGLPPTGYLPAGFPQQMPSHGPNIPPHNTGTNFMNGFASSTSHTKPNGSEVSNLTSTWPSSFAQTSAGPPSSSLPLSASASSSQYLSGISGARSSSYTGFAPSSLSNTNTASASAPSRDQGVSSSSSGTFMGYPGSGSYPSQSAASDMRQGGLSYPARPASTSILHNMIGRLNSYDAEHSSSASSSSTTTRPSSAPGPDYRPSSSSSSSSFVPDFASLSQTTSMTSSLPFTPGLFNSQPPRLSAPDSTLSFPGSQSTMFKSNGGVGGPQPQLGMATGLPGGFPFTGGLSQPNPLPRGAVSRAGDELFASMSGCYGLGFGQSSAFNGGFTQ